MTDFKNLRKNWDCHLISTLHAIELIFSEYEYVLTSKDHMVGMCFAHFALA